MSRIATTFSERSRSSQYNRALLIVYITAGDPDLTKTVDMMHGLVKAGVDIIELGVAFSDPQADGPPIQRASERAMAAGVNMDRILEMVATFRQTDTHTPVVLMGYLNPIEVYGYDRFATAASTAGVDGVLTVDIPAEEADALQVALQKQGLDMIFLVSPTTGEHRIKAIAKSGSGFVYYVSLKGVTGSSKLDVSSVNSRLEAIKQYIDMPIAVGFGISSPKQAKELSQTCDAVVVGSAFVNLIEEKFTENSDVSSAELAQVLQDKAQTFTDALQG